MQQSFTFSITSRIKADKASVWYHMSSMAGVNLELSPYIKMTYPKDKANLSDLSTQFISGETIFVSFLLLFGLIPIDVHFLRLDAFDKGISFTENSVSLLQESWKHHRILIQTSAECVDVTDTVTFQPRLPLLGHLLLPMVRFVFRGRHINLQSMFHGGDSCSASASASPSLSDAGSVS